MESLHQHRVSLPTDHCLFAGLAGEGDTEFDSIFTDLLDALELERLDKERTEFRIGLQLRADLLDELADFINIGFERDTDAELVDSPIAAGILDRAKRTKRYGEDWPTVVPQPNGTKAEGFHDAGIVSCFDVFSDSEGNVQQIENAADDVLDQGLRPESNCNAELPNRPLK